MSKQISRYPDEANITNQGTIGDFSGGLVSNTHAIVASNTLSIMQNLDITINGSLITRPGLTRLMNLHDFIDFERLLGYRSYLTDYWRIPNPGKAESTIVGGHTSVGGYKTIQALTSYEYLIIYFRVGDVDNSNSMEQIVYPALEGKYRYTSFTNSVIKFQLTNDELVIDENDSNIHIVKVVAVNKDLIDNPTVRDNTARGNIEYAIVLVKSDESLLLDPVKDYTVDVWCRFSKIDKTTSNLITPGEWLYSGTIAELNDTQLTESTQTSSDEISFYLNKRIFSTFNKDHVFLSTPQGLYKLRYEVGDDDIKTIWLKLTNLMDTICVDRYKPNTAEVTVNGYNLLSPNAEIETQDSKGIVNAITGIVVQGVSIENRTQPFKVQEPLVMEAFVSYVLYSARDNMSFKWSYDYLGTGFTNNISMNKHEGDFKINDDYGNHKLEKFTPSFSGMFRIYCQMKMDGESTDGKRIDRYVFTDIQVEVDNKVRDDSEYLFLYDAIKQSKIIRRFRDYYIVGGASQTTNYSSKLFISAPDDMSYFPQNYVISMPSGVFVSDFFEYKNKLCILTNDGVYYMSGDAPYSACIQATDGSLEPFTTTKLHGSIKSLYNDNSAVTPDGVVTYSGTIYKLFDKSTDLQNVKDVGTYVENMLPSNGFLFTQQIGETTYFVYEDEILIYETLDYDIYGISNRYKYYHMHGLIVKDIFDTLNQTMFVLETGEICLLDKNVRGYDLTHPFGSEFRTNADKTGNNYYPKKFKKFFYEILPLVNEVYQPEELYVDVCEGDEGCVPERFSIDYSLDVWLDNEQVINSMYIETVEQFGGGWKTYAVRSENMSIRGDIHMITNPKFNIRYSKAELHKIFGNDMVDPEQLATFAYVGEVRLRSRGGKNNIEAQLRFHTPVMIHGIGYDFKNRSTKGHYSGNNMRHYRRIRK